MKLGAPGLDFQAWETLNVTGETVYLNAELEQEPEKK
jgi:hypothetical protein